METFTAGGETFIHPSQTTEAQRHENMAAMHDRFARAFAKVGDKANGAAAQDAARRRRASAARA